MTAIAVKLWGNLVGAITWDDDRSLGRFAYAPEFVDSGLEIAPLTMPLTRNRLFEFPAHVRTKSFMGLPGLIADCLPEKFGNAVLAAKLGKVGRSLDEVTPVERLTYLGARSMGALEFEPDYDTWPDSKPVSIVIEELVSVAEAVLKQRGSTESSLSNGNFDTLVQVGTSAGGAKAKAVIAWNEETNQVVSGASKAPEGFGYWLMKFDEVHNEEHATSRHIGQIEYAYYKMALLADIPMMRCELFEDAGRHHFMAERFDRYSDGEKVHVQSFCGMAHADRDPPGSQGYEQLFVTARKLGLGQDTLDQIYRRMVFNILARNHDDHTKNHAFMMDMEGQWELTPAYDICFSYKPGNKFIESHQMSCNGKREGFSYADLIQAARAGDVSNPQQIIEQVNDALLAWPDIAKDAGLEAKQYASIQQQFRNISAKERIITIKDEQRFRPG
ncbi:MAG: type II toxin-antitoxin system HipA family toxin [Motiliproteus sp.]